VRREGAVRWPLTAQRRLSCQFLLASMAGQPRIVKKADYRPRWRSHYVLVRSQADLDDELKTWLREAHDVVGLQRGLRAT
jgi:hypothetical protein